MLAWPHCIILFRELERDEILCSVLLDSPLPYGGPGYWSDV
jgi:hypothetical protein